MSEPEHAAQEMPDDMDADLSALPSSFLGDLQAVLPHLQLVAKARENLDAAKQSRQMAEDAFIRAQEEGLEGAGLQDKEKAWEQAAEIELAMWKYLEKLIKAQEAQAKAAKESLVYMEEMTVTIKRISR